MLHHKVQSPGGQAAFVQEEKTPMIILDLVVQYPSWQMKTLN